MKSIPLTNSSSVVVVDDEDWGFLSETRWQLNPETRIVQRCERVFGKIVTLLLARVVMNAPKRMKVDHANHDTLDNRKTNLRLCSRSQNGMNRRKQLAPSTSRFKGVHFVPSSGKWIAQIGIRSGKRKQKHLGCFHNETDAAKAYNVSAKLHFGEFAFLNPA